MAATSDEPVLTITRTTKRRREIDERPSYMRVPDASGERQLRVVAPYAHTFESGCKARWVGRMLLDVYKTEFCERAEQYFARAIRAGMIRVNGRMSTLDYSVRDGDVLTHLSHRHEPPVAWIDARDMIVHDDGDVMILNKPSSIPVHPSGSYRFNSVIEILAHELGLRELHTVHRLDRVTSGLLLMARRLDTAKRLSALIERREVRKTYVALVRGKFPATEAEWLASSRSRDLPCAAPPSSAVGAAAGPPELQSTGVRFDSTRPGGMVVSYPLAVLDHRRGLHRCDALHGKPSVTRVRLAAFDASNDTSVVVCEPLTGRTHQIRLHLQYLGYPIVNDPVYGAVPGLDPGVADDVTNDEEFDEIAELDDVQQALATEGETVTSGEGETDEARLKRMCRLCRRQAELKLRHGGAMIFLHSARFVAPASDGADAHDWRAPLPEWCAETNLDDDDKNIV